MPSFINMTELETLKKQKIALLVSGGPDSVFLFHQFLALRAKECVQFSVLHFNHHLREKESDAEQDFVQNLCRKFHVPCLIVHLRQLPETHVQEAARYKRQFHLFRLKKRYGFDVFLTAHHQDDCLETLIMRAGRGAGFKGLVGIKPRQRIQRKGDFIEFWRPLLSFGKDNILSYLNKNNFSYCVDSSNANTKYLRNRVRQELVPALTKTEQQTILSLSQNLYCLTHYISKRVQYLCRRYHFFVPIGVWQTWPEPMQFYFTAHVLRRLGFKEQVEEKHFRPFNKKKLKVLMGNVLIYKDEAGLYFLKHTPEKNEHAGQVISQAGTYYLHEFPGIFSFRNTEKPENFPARELGRPLFISSKFMEQGMRITTVKPWETLIPFGHHKAVPVKKIFQIYRIPQFQRLFWPVLKNTQDQILAVLGLEISEHCKVSSDSQCLKMNHLSGYY